MKALEKLLAAEQISEMNNLIEKELKVLNEKLILITIIEVLKVMGFPNDKINNLKILNIIKYRVDFNNIK
ncbi:MAG: hypothetical protein IJS56_05700 [Bacilli bacterium]|nr:hypothetical protein [Bacilli bacterium]